MGDIKLGDVGEPKRRVRVEPLPDRRYPERPRRGTPSEAPDEPVREPSRRETPDREKVPSR
jgi:hypothetical protein